MAEDSVGIDTQKAAPRPRWNVSALDDLKPEGRSPASYGASGVLHAFSQAFSICYDYLGLTVLGSFTTFVLLALVWILVPPSLFGPSLLMQSVRLSMLSPMVHVLLAGPMLLATRMAERDEPSTRDLFAGWQRGLGDTATFGAVEGIVFAVLVGDMLFFAHQASPVWRAPALPFALLALFQMVSWPFRWTLASRPSISLRRAWLLSAALAMGLPAPALLASVLMVALSALSAAIGFGLVVALPVVLSCAMLLATESLVETLDLRISKLRDATGTRAEPRVTCD